MPADAAGWSIDLSLQRIRDCAALASLVRNADATERRWLGRQLASVLAALPAAQDELVAQSVRLNLPHLQELARQVAMLETVVLELEHLNPGT
jgi:hypothetical protein